MEWKINGIVRFHHFSDKTLKSIQIHYALVYLYFNSSSSFILLTNATFGKRSLYHGHMKSFIKMCSWTISRPTDWTCAIKRVSLSLLLSLCLTCVCVCVHHTAKHINISKKQSKMKPTNENTFSTTNNNNSNNNDTKNRNKYIILFMVCAFRNCQWCIPKDKVPHVVCA